jgi:hypothetical protein
MGNFSVAGISFAITSGLSSSSRAASSLSALETLNLYPGYKDSSEVDSSDLTVALSPNTSGFLLSASMATDITAPVKYLLDNLWTTMLSANSYSSGASWEYVGQDGQPALGLFTSLSHPWGGAATYILTEYVTEIRPQTPGYETFLINPRH